MQLHNFHPLATIMHSKWDSSHLTSVLNVVLVFQSPRGRNEQLQKVINPPCCRNLLQNVVYFHPQPWAGLFLANQLP